MKVLVIQNAGFAFKRGKNKINVYFWLVLQGMWTCQMVDFLVQITAVLWTLSRSGHAFIQEVYMMVLELTQVAIGCRMKPNVFHIFYFCRLFQSFKATIKCISFMLVS